MIITKQKVKNNGKPLVDTTKVKVPKPDNKRDNKNFNKEFR